MALAADQKCGGITTYRHVPNLCAFYQDTRQSVPLLCLTLAFSVSLKSITASESSSIDLIASFV